MSLEGSRVLYISYNGMLDPLGQSQVIPYLRELSRRGVQFTLLSFERDEAWTVEGAERCKELASSLESDGIDWHRLRYHRRPSLPATVYDVLAGIRKASALVRRGRIQAVHARSHIPATIALGLKRRFGLKLIFDVRGLMAEEYVDAGHWKQGSIPYRLTKNLEKRAFAAADGVVTLTHRIWPIIRDWEGLRGREVSHEVVPCCADLNRFQFDPEARRSVRTRLGLEGRFVVVYSGSIGGWYLTEEMADFFETLLNNRRDAHAMWLTPNGHDRVRSLMEERKISSTRYTVVASPPQEVASYLSASDAGLAFIKPCFSKLASSPTKNAEYLACGLPVVINGDVGDSDALVTVERVGRLVASFNQESYLEAIRGLQEDFGNAEHVRAHSRSVAERLFDVGGVGIDRYTRLYSDVLNAAPGPFSAENPVSGTSDGASPAAARRF